MKQCLLSLRAKRSNPAFLKRWIAASLTLLALTGNLNAAPNPLGSGKYNTNQPIEINADSLEVFQQENRAVFIGHVVAIQGDVRLKSDKMNVFYRGNDGKKSAGGQDAIQKIEVTGNVFLSTPEETASGELGIYDVANKKIHLNNKVVLTRGKNVLKGDKLTYDLEAGKSVIGSGEAVASDGKKERVKALFVPDKAGDKK